MANGKSRQRARNKKRRKKAGRSSSNLIVWGVAALVVLAVGLIILLNGSSSNQKGTTAPAGSPAPQSIVADVTDVPASALAAAGAGGSEVNIPGKMPTGTAPLTSNGKPEVLYVGAEYCPYCASQRWPLAQALSRFGSFKNLGLSYSAANDVFPNTPTLSFYGSTYSSPYVVFTPVETATTTGQPLQQLSADQQKLLDTYDGPPYVPASSKGAIPFLYLGGSYLQSGASVSPQMLTGMTHAQIAKSLSDPSSKAGQAIDASANVLTAAICQLTKGQPSDVCTSAPVQAAAQRLATGQ